MAATKHQSQTLTFHGHDNVSIRMLKICDLSIYKPLEIIFRTCLNHGKFPEERQATNKKATSNVLKMITLYPCYQL